MKAKPKLGFCWELSFDHDVIVSSNALCCLCYQERMQVRILLDHQNDEDLAS